MVLLRHPFIKPRQRKEKWSVMIWVGRTNGRRKLHKGFFSSIKGAKGIHANRTHEENLFSIPWVFDHKMELLMEAVNNFPD